MDRIKFGNKLKELREAANHSQDDLGGKLSVGPKQIQRYEKGEVLPDHEKMETLCQLYSYDFLSIIYDIPREFQKEDFQRKYYLAIEDNNNLLKSENSELKKKVSSLEGQIRHYLLMTHAIVQTNQDALKDLLVKGKIVEAEKVNDRLSIKNVENYQRLKVEAGIG